MKALGAKFDNSHAEIDETLAEPEQLIKRLVDCWAGDFCHLRYFSGGGLRNGLDAKQPGPWRDALALLEASFPRNRAEMESRFRLLSVTQTNAVWQLALQPKSSLARRMMSATRGTRSAE